MKKSLYLISSALVALAAFSCAHKSSVTEDLVEWTFEAPATKASFDESGKFSWEASDRIAVWNATSAGFVHFTTVTGSGKFRAMAPSDAHFTSSAYYPVSIAKGENLVSIDGSGMPMCALIDDGSNVLNFKHIGAFVGVSVINIDPLATEFVLYSTGTTLCGDVPLSGGVWLKDGTPGVLRIPLSGETSLTLTIPVPVGEYTLGYRIENAEHETLLTRETESDFTFQRATLYRFPVASMEPDVLEETLTVELEAFEVDDDSSSWE